MRIINETHWRSDHLLAFIRRAAKEELDPGTLKLMRVKIRYNRAGTRHRYVSGRAACPGNWIRLMLPSGDIDRVDLAGVIAHEMAHTRGLRHVAMRGNPRYRRTGEDHRAFYAWADTLPLERKPELRRARTSADQRLSLAQQMVARWSRKRKLADTYLKKWTRRASRLEKEMLKAAQSVPEVNE